MLKPTKITLLLPCLNVHNSITIFIIIQLPANYTSSICMQILFYKAGLVFLNFPKYVSVNLIYLSTLINFSFTMKLFTLATRITFLHLNIVFDIKFTRLFVSSFIACSQTFLFLQHLLLSKNTISTIILHL